MATSTAIQIKDAAANVLFPRVRTSDLVTNDLTGHIFDDNNRIKADYLPSYVDDVIDVEGAFLYTEIGPSGETSTVAIPAVLASNAYYLDGSAMKIRHTNGTASTNLDTGSALETGKIYVTSKGQQFRYTGAQLVPIVPFGTNMGITTSMNHADGDTVDNNPDNTLTTARAVARYTINKIANSTISNVTSSGYPITVTTDGRNRKIGLDLDSNVVNGVKIHISGTKLKASAALTTGASNSYGTVAAWTTTDANVVAIAANAAGSKYIVPTMQTLYAVKSALLTSITNVDGAGLTSVLADAPLAATDKTNNQETISINIDSTAVNGVKVEVSGNKLKASAATATTASYGTVKTVTTVAATAGEALVPTTSAVWTALAGKAATHSHPYLSSGSKATIKDVASGVNETTYVTPKVLNGVLNFYNVRKVLEAYPTTANTPAGFFAVSATTSAGLYYADTAGTAAVKVPITDGVTVVWSNTSLLYEWNNGTWGYACVHWNGISGKPAVYPTDWTSIDNRPSTFPPSTHTHAYLASGDVSGENGVEVNSATAGKAKVKGVTTKGDNATIGVVRTATLTAANVVSAAATHSYTSYVVPTIQTLYNVAADLKTSIGSGGTHDHAHATGAGDKSGFVVTSNTIASTTTAFGNTSLVPTMNAVHSAVTSLVTAIGGKAAATHSHTIANISNLQTNLDSKLNAANTATVHAIASGVNNTTYVTPLVLTSVLTCYNVRAIYSSLPTAANTPAGFFAVSGAASAGLYYAESAGKAGYKMTIPDGTLAIWSNTSYIYQWNASDGWGRIKTHWDSISGRPDFDTLYAPKTHTHNYAAASHDHGHANGTGSVSGFVVTSNTIASTANTFGTTSLVPTMNAVHSAITSLAGAIDGKQGTMAANTYVASVKGDNGITPTTAQTGAVTLKGVTTKGDNATIGVVRTATLAATGITSQAATHSYTSYVVPTIQTLFNVTSDLKTSIGSGGTHDHAHANGNGAASGFVVTQSTITSTTNAFGNTSLVPVMNAVHGAITSLVNAINGKAATHTHPYVSTTWKATVAEIASNVTESTYVNPKTLQSVLQFYNVRTVLEAFPAAANIPGGFWAVSAATSAGLYYTSAAKGTVIKVPITDGCTVVWSNTSLLYEWNSGAWGYACVHWNGISGKPAVYPTDWSSIGNKPGTFPPAAHNHDTAYAAASHDHKHANGTGGSSGFVVTSNTIVSTANAFGTTSLVPTMNAVHSAVTSLATAIDLKQPTLSANQYVKSVKGTNGIAPATAQTGDVTLSCTNANAGTTIGAVYTSNRIPTGAVNGDTTSVVPTLGAIRASCLFYTTL